MTRTKQSLALLASVLLMTQAHAAPLGQVKVTNPNDFSVYVYAAQSVSAIGKTEWILIGEVGARKVITIPQVPNGALFKVVKQGEDKELTRFHVIYPNSDERVFRHFVPGS